MEFELNAPVGSMKCKPANDGKSTKQDVPEPQINPFTAEIESRLEVGSVVEDIEHAYVLYCEYARGVGFSAKKAQQSYFYKTSEIKMKDFQCSCEGHTDNKRSKNRLAAYKKQVTRTGCRASLRVGRAKEGPWTVISFNKDHNHELLDPDQSYLLRSARNLSDPKISVLEVLHKAGIQVSRIYRFMENEAGGVENVGFIRKDAYTHLDKQRTHAKVDNGDAGELMQYFIYKSNNEPYFFWKTQLDDDGRLLNFFFRDTRCAIDYEYFGDVMTVDSTYRTNRYNLSCVSFIGINHHMSNVLFGLAFLSDETTKSFEWLFQTFLESMNGKEPESIFSDQCQALMNGMDYTFKTASHRLCQWHINQNAPAHFGSLNGVREFKKNWYHCMNGCETEDEFEQSWAVMVDTYSLSHNRWFTTMYNLRRRWSSVYTQDRYTTGLHATSRSESTNRVIKDLCSNSGSLYEFVMKYEQIQTDWRVRERAEDALCRGVPGQFVPDNRLLTQAADVYTRTVYKMFEAQVLLSINIDLLHHPSNYNSEDIVFSVVDNVGSTKSRIVYFNQQTNSSSCSCHMWEGSGILCRHICKVWLLMNVHHIPECYILKRLMKDAKLRIGYSNPPSVQLPKADALSEMVFVNQMMRVVYDIVYSAKEKPDSCALINERISDLRDEMTTLNTISGEGPNRKPSKPTTTGKNQPHQAFKNPHTMKRRGFESTRRTNAHGRGRGRSDQPKNKMVSSGKADQDMSEKEEYDRHKWTQSSLANESEWRVNENIVFPSKQSALASSLNN